MEKPLSLTILYTANIHGDLNMLPRLYTFIQSLKPPQRQGTLLFDLGNFCGDDVWHCEITWGRSTLMILDAMGYHAVNIENQLDATNRQKVTDVTTLGLVDSHHRWHYHIPPVLDESIQAVFSPLESTQRLQICLSPTHVTQLDNNVLFLADIPSRHVGIVEVDLNSHPKLISHKTKKLPDNIPPNPTIVASVEFVESEARYFAKKQSSEQE